MGAVLYHQACDNYLDEKMTASSKPNNKPYKKGAYYTGKEHSWDEAFGYWGAAAHTMKLTAAQSYDIAKKKDLKAADYNNDGVVDLKTVEAVEEVEKLVGFAATANGKSANNEDEEKKEKTKKKKIEVL